MRKSRQTVVMELGEELDRHEEMVLLTEQEVRRVLGINRRCTWGQAVEAGEVW